MTAVSIELAPDWLAGHLYVDRYDAELVKRLRLRGYRCKGYWGIPRKDVKQLARDLEAWGYTVVVEGEAA